MISNTPQSRSHGRFCTAVTVTWSLVLSFFRVKTEEPQMEPAGQRVILIMAVCSICLLAAGIFLAIRRGVNFDAMSLILAALILFSVAESQDSRRKNQS